MAGFHCTWFRLFTFLLSMHCGCYGQCIACVGESGDHRQRERSLKM